MNLAISETYNANHQCSYDDAIICNEHDEYSSRKFQIRYSSFDSGKRVHIET